MIHEGALPNILLVLLAGVKSKGHEKSIVKDNDQ